ncbi:MAG: indolepyruvate oxidoreductase subunit beta [Chloroflexi bacterium]|nr:indolepyruvate oxidoreductase subunit beta [Chloroflexota bacterium]
MATPTSLIFAGVGGQGVLLIAELTARAAIRAGYDAKQTEVHGVSQRGGGVESHVRFGQVVHSPLVMPGQAEVVVGLEKLEALRFAHFVRPGGGSIHPGDSLTEGVVLVNDHEIVPASVLGAEQNYPHHGLDFLQQKGLQVVVLPASRLARDLGDGRMANVIMLGALSRMLELPAEAWLETLRERLPKKYREANLRAFSAGRELFAHPEPEAMARP